MITTYQILKLRNLFIEKYIIILIFFFPESLWEKKLHQMIIK